MILVPEILLVSAIVLRSLALLPDRNDTDAAPDPFTVPLASLSAPADPLHYRGLPLTADHPDLKYPGAWEVLEVAQAFPDALSCLEHTPGDDSVSLARLTTHRFESRTDLEVCLQRVGNQLDDVAQVKPWLEAIGFGRVDEKPASFWWSSHRLGLHDADVAVFQAYWRRRPYPFSLHFRLTRTWSDAMALYARSMDLTLVIRRGDLRVIDVYATLIFL